jgi:hypothetical protein
MVSFSAKHGLVLHLSIGYHQSMRQNEPVSIKKGVVAHGEVGPRENAHDYEKEKRARKNE